MKIFHRRREVKIHAGDRIRRRDIWSGIAPDAMPQPYPAMSTPTDLDDIPAVALEGHDSDQEIEQLLTKASRRRAA